MFYLALPFHIFTGLFAAMPAVLFGALIGIALGIPGAAVREAVPPLDSSAFVILFSLLAGGCTDALGVFQVQRTGDRDPARVARPRLITMVGTAVICLGLVGFGRFGGWVGMVGLIGIHAVYFHHKLDQLPAPGAPRVVVLLLSVLVLVAILEPTGLWRAMVR